MRCKHGHALKLVKLGMMRGWVHQRCCEYCQTDIPRSTARYHCRACDVTLCKGCALPQRTEGMGPGTEHSTSVPGAVPPKPCGEVIPGVASMPACSQAAKPNGRYLSPRQKFQHADDGYSKMPIHCQQPAEPTSAGSLSTGIAPSQSMSSPRFTSTPTARQSPAVSSPRLDATAADHSRQMLQASNPTCSRGHGLSQHVRDMFGSTICNSCGRAGIRPPEHVFRCELCDFDLCQSCYRSRGASSCPVPLTTALTSPRPARAAGEGHPMQHSHENAAPGHAARPAGTSHAPTTAKAAVGEKRKRLSGISFATEVEWIFFDDEDDVHCNLSRMLLQADPGPFHRKRNTSPLCATWCPRGSACPEHGGLFWADAGARAAMMEAHGEQGISRCPYQKPSQSVRKCDPEAWGPDIPDTSEDFDEQLLPCMTRPMPTVIQTTMPDVDATCGLQPQSPRRYAGLTARKTITPAQADNACGIKSLHHCHHQQLTPTPISTVWPNRHDSHRLLHVY